MENEKNTPENKDTQVTKQNMDFPNIPASSDKINDESEVKKEIRETTKLHDEGKTDNTEKSN